MRLYTPARTKLLSFSVLCTVFALTWAPPSSGQPADAVAVHQPNAAIDQANAISTPKLFRVENPAALQLGSIMDFAKRELKITLQNIHDDSMQIERIRVTCSCLIMEQAPPPTLLKPQDKISFSVKLDAAEIKPGPFTRMVLVELAGQDITLVYISGVVQPMMSFAPGQVLNLGTFAGKDVSWERSITITSMFPEEQAVSFQPPAEDDLFSYKLLSESPQVYKLTVRPKLPLPIGKMHHLVHLPVTGMDNYGPVVVAISGMVTGWRPVLDNEQLIVTLSEHKPAEAIVKNVRLVIKEQAANAQPMPPLIPAHHDHGQHHAEDNPNAVAKEELASSTIAQLAFWEDIAKDVTSRLPPSVTMTKTPQLDSLLLTLTFPTDFFTHRRRLIMPFSHKKYSCGMLTITVRP